jgi:DNA-directed RNA polymerase subunit RPC12/RpoP
MSVLEPLACPRCGAKVPLAIAASPRGAGETRCPHCGHEVAVPEPWRVAAEAKAAAEAVRREVEPHWQALTRPPSLAFEIVAAAAVFVVPVVASWIVLSRVWPPPSPVTTMGLVAVPALLPGALAWLWAATMGATVLRLQRALRARGIAGGELSCRSCGAPLAVAEGALASTCLYCGSDSLVRDLPPVAASTAARDSALSTLASATQALRRRRVNLTLGIAALGLGVSAVSMSAALAFALAF